MHSVVTGSNRGIGLEFCRQLSGQGRVTALCRQASTELKQLPVTAVEGVDITRPSELNPAGVIDLLVLNAGIWRDEVFPGLNYDTLLEQFEVNTLGPLRVLEALESRLKAGSKVVLITSKMGSIAENASGGRYGYRVSKAALNAAGVSLAHDLKSRQIAVALLHPGYVATDMTRFKGTILPQESVAGMLRVIEGLNLENSGSFWDYQGKVVPW